MVAYVSKHECDDRECQERVWQNGVLSVVVSIERVMLGCF